MATKKELSSSLASYIRRNSLNSDIIEEVSNKLDTLIYSNTGDHLSNEDKLEIINEIDSDLKTPRVGNYRYLTESENSNDFIHLMQSLTNKYKK